MGFLDRFTQPAKSPAVARKRPVAAATGATVAAAKVAPRPMPAAAKAAGGGVPAARPQPAPGLDSYESAAGVVVLANGSIETESDLAEALSFSKVLSEQVGLSGHLYSQICPLLVHNDSKSVIVLVTPQYRRSDETLEVLKLLAQKQYNLQAPPRANVFTCQTQLILAVAKGQITAADLGTTKKLSQDKNQSALWGTFVDAVSWAFREKASDVHVNVNVHAERSQIMFTIGGKYVAPKMWQMPTATLQQMLGVAYQKAKGGVDATFIPTKEQQCNIFLHIKDTNERVMLRWASMATDDGPQVTMRLLQLDALLNTVTLEALGYLPSHIAMLTRAMKSEGGAIIFAGVVGSGKSTTIATVMGQIPRSRKVMTLEDPREYIIEGSHACTISRPLDGSGDDSFNAKLRTLKRSAFNDLLLGEIRDRETGIVFQDVVLSGQNLYSTTHARSAIGIPDKLASPMVGVDRDVLATPGALKLLVYQALLPVNCPHCKVRGDELLASDDRMEPYIARLNRLYRMTPEQLYFRNPDGCPQCRREGLPELNGFKGRTVVAEMCEPDDQMLEFLKDSQNLELQRYVSTLKRGDYMDSNMDYKSTLENAIYKMGTGLIDPREIEPRFSSFETIEIRRRNAEELDARKALLAAANNQRRARENRPPPPGMPDFVPTSPGSL